MIAYHHHTTIIIIGRSAEWSTRLLRIIAGPSGQCRRFQQSVRTHLKKNNATVNNSLTMKQIDFGNDNETDYQNAFSEELKRKLEMSTEYFLVPNYTKNIQRVINQTGCANCGNEKYEFIRGELWVFPVLVFAGLLMVSIICFELFIICKAYKLSSSHRNIFLGQILLLGLFLCASVSVVLTLTPTIVSCSVVRFGIGVSYALVFASLLVKCVFLISLNSGVYLPAAYQALLLAFSILIQVAISGQWLISNPPAVESVVYERFITERKHNMLFTAKDLEKPEISKRCQTGYTDLLFSLIYVVFLIIFVSVLAIKARHVRNNYRESTYIGLSVGCSVPTWLVWMLSGFLVNERHRDACLALGLLISSFVIFSVMFMSKSRRLIALGSNGVYKEDRDDQFSSISRTGSRYSPSFFHYQPGDLRHQYIYQNKGIQATHSNPDLGTDDGNVYTTLEPTLSSNPNVYFYCSNGVHPGMIY